MHGRSIASLTAGTLMRLRLFRRPGAGPRLRAARRSWQGAGRGRLHGLPSDQSDHAQLRLYPRGLAGADRHDDRPLRQPGGPGHDHRLSGGAFSAEHRAGAEAGAGRRRIAFKEWQVPTLGQRSRDPVEAADGSIWWAGQWGNLVGRIDPATGEMKEYPLPANAMPHTVILDGPATSGTRATRTARSASSIRRPARSPSSRCPIPRRRIRTRRCSTRRASSGSRSSRAT